MFDHHIYNKIIKDLKNKMEEFDSVFYDVEKAVYNIDFKRVSELSEYELLILQELYRTTRKIQKMADEEYERREHGLKDE